MKCIVVDDNEMALLATCKLVSRVSFLELARSFTDPVEALSFLAKEPMDLVFLDIEMPELNGIDFIKALQHPQPMVIMTTTSKSHALHAYESNAVDYLVKPIEVSRFMKAVAKARVFSEKRDVEGSDEQAVFVKKDGMMVKIKKSDIVCIEGLGDYVVLNTEKEKYVVHSTMQSMEEKFDSKEFLRVHRSFIIRLDKISRIEENTISCLNKLIPIGKTYLKQVYSRLNLL